MMTDHTLRLASSVAKRNMLICSMDQTCHAIDWNRLLKVEGDSKTIFFHKNKDLIVKQYDVTIPCGGCKNMLVIGKERIVTVTCLHCECSGIIQQFSNCELQCTTMVKDNYLKAKFSERCRVTCGQCSKVHEFTSVKSIQCLHRYFFNAV